MPNTIPSLPLQLPPARAPLPSARRQLNQPERARAILHSILLFALCSHSRLLRLPLAFLEAFPGFLADDPSSSAATAGVFAGEGEGGRATRPPSLPSEEADIDVLSPGVWRRAAIAALFSGGGAVAEGGGAALIAARLKLVCSNQSGGGGGGEGEATEKRGTKDGAVKVGGDKRDAAWRLAEDIVLAVGALHGGGDRGGSCPLCAGGGDDAACGRDDALAMSTAAVAAVAADQGAEAAAAAAWEGRKEGSDGVCYL